MESIGTWWMWAAFAAFVVVAIVVDLLVLERKGAAKVSFKEALGWSIVWIILSFIFNGLLWWYLDGKFGREVANETSMEFFTGYLIEKSLAVDNIFVFLMLFTFFGVPAQYQRRVLILGIIGAIVLRAIMILIGAWLIAQFHWVLYLFGLFLLITGVKMLMMAEAESDLEQNPILRWMRSRMPITNEFHAENFTVIKDGKRWFTPLFVVMVMIGITDVIFAVDSIPAIFAVTLDPFIVLT
jgi:tellurite resistance protein TerC